MKTEGGKRGGGLWSEDGRRKSDSPRRHEGREESGEKTENLYHHRDTEFTEERPQSHSRRPRMGFDSAVVVAVLRVLCVSVVQLALRHPSSRLVVCVARCQRACYPVTTIVFRTDLVNALCTLRFTARATHHERRGEATAPYQRRGDDRRYSGKRGACRTTCGVDVCAGRPRRNTADQSMAFSPTRRCHLVTRLPAVCYTSTRVSRVRASVRFVLNE